MRIYEMTATFGKLNHETLTLRPGLNIIEAPNEWGKSTWCAFLLAMLYGLDTRAKTTRTVLSEKEHYQPWSGQPMSGRILLSYGGRDITIERSTRGRVPLGEFSAYETATGLPVAELNSSNCGEILMGAEQSVFRRAGFLRLADLPVTRDDALMRRLNALVTTGDESGDGDRLGRDLKALRNKCRYHKTGLMPQAEQELSKVQSDLRELYGLQENSQAFAARIEETSRELEKLNLHLQHLKNQEASADAARVSQARKQAEEAKNRCKHLSGICRDFPSREELLKKQKQLTQFAQRLDELLKQNQVLESIDPPPAAPPAFAGMNPKEAVQMAKADQKAYELLKLNFTIVWILAAVCCGAAAVLCFALKQTVLSILFLLGIPGFLAGAMVCRNRRARKLENFTEKYGNENPDNWLLSANFYLKAAESYEKDAAKAREDRRQISGQLDQLKKEQCSLCGNRGVQETLERLQKMLSCHDSLSQAQKDWKQAEAHLQTLMAMAKHSCETEGEDDLFLDETETREKIRETREKQQKLLGQMGQYQGRMESLGTEDQLKRQEKSLEERLSKLQEYYDALNIALTQLEEASAELQRRFAPRITRRAQDLMSRMTDGRYEKLNFSEEFLLTAGTSSEDVLKNALYRSEGTIDQLYFSIRLAVARELMPEAPLILDDALLRFDGERLGKALDILKEEDRQVILFTCQDREGKLIPSAAAKK